MSDHASSRFAGLLSVSTALRLIAAAGLAVDARIHFKLAPAYDGIKSSTISQGDLFRIEAVAAVIAALAILVFSRPVAALAAVLVAGGGLVPLLVYRFYDVGAIGPLPPMYEPAWYPDKTHTAWAQAIAAVAALAFLVIARRRTRKHAAAA